MSLILSGTDGLSDVDGSASTPAIRGTDANTGIFFPAADTIAFAEGGTESMRIDSNGNVGIGITSPTGRLNVRSTYVSDTTTQQRFEDNTGSALSFGGTGGGVKWLNVADTGTPSTGYPLAFQTGGTERMRITPAGYVKASNDGTYQSSTGDYHEFRNTASVPAIWLSATNASYDSTVLQLRATRNTTDASFYAIQYFNTGASASKFLVADSGNVTNTNGSYGTISDIKNKENIVDATPKLDKVNQLKVRNFNFIDDDLKQIGFIAQEFEEVFPSMVEVHTDKDENGIDLGTTTKSIKTSVLVPILVKAIQELKAIVDAQALEIAELKAKP